MQQPLAPWQEVLPPHPAAAGALVLAVLEGLSACPSLQQCPGQRQVLSCASHCSDRNSHIFGGGCPHLSMEPGLRRAVVLGKSPRLWRAAQAGSAETSGGLSPGQEDSPRKCSRCVP